MKHWTDDDFTEWIYGLKTDSAHLDECTECRAKANSVAESRAEAVRAPEVSWEFLAAQRRSLYRRISRPERHWSPARWITSVAMLVVAVALSFGIWHQPGSTAPLASPTDVKLIADLASIEQSNEPRAIKPIESLFEQ